MDIIFASNNLGKVNEVKFLTEQIKNISVKSLKDLGIDLDVIEDQPTFLGNAVKKALDTYAVVKKPVISEDSGLCVKALDGRPGVYSHRYAGEDPIAGCHKLLEEMKDVPKELRDAYFICVMCYYDGENLHITQGICNGEITTELKGTNGFGFDPVFYYEEYDQTFSEMDEIIKNTVSHRRKALRNMVNYLEDRFMI